MDHIFEDHDVKQSQIPQVFPSINIEDLINNESIAKALTVEVIEKRDELFNAEKAWLEGDDSHKQQTIPICRFSEKIEKSDKDNTELLLISDREEPFKYSEWSILFVLKTIIKEEINGKEIASFLPCMHLCFSLERVRQVNDVLLAASEKGLKIYSFSYEESETSLSKISSGIDFFVNFRNQFKSLRISDPWIYLGQRFFKITKEF